MANCNICGRKLDLKSCYKVPHGSKPMYFCSKLEVERYRNNKEDIPIGEKIYNIFCRIMDELNIIDQAFDEERELWWSIAEDSTIYRYLQAREDYLSSVAKRLKGEKSSLKGRIKYISAIIKRELPDWRVSIQAVVVEDFVPNFVFKNVVRERRKGLSELEDEFDG